MSHGKEDGVICDIDGADVKLAHIKHLLSSSEFPAMSGKPKIIIVQACSGGKSILTLIRKNLSV